MRSSFCLLLCELAIACCWFSFGCSDNSPGCLVDTDCPASEICDQGQCVNGTCLGGCPAGKYCSGQTCANCQDDWHCGDKCVNCKGAVRNKVCRQGACGCNSMDDCSLGESCVEGNCQNVALCGNGKTDPGETCGEPGLPVCPSDCDDGNPCTSDLLTGSAQNCNAACSHSLVSLCQGGDNCCPASCNSGNDSDCSASCGNGVPDSGETCGEPGLPTCPTSCDDGNPCTNDLMTGSPANCNVSCSHSPTGTCQLETSDGCCFPGCNHYTDLDCYPEADDAFALNELDFMRAIYPRYVNVNADFRAIVGHILYRSICSQSIMSFVDRLAGNGQIQPADPDFQEFQAILFPASDPDSGLWAMPYDWIIAEAYFECLLAANLARNALTSEQRDILLSKAVLLADWEFQNYPVSTFQNNDAYNAGNTQAEEVGLTASFLTQVAKLVPASYLGEQARADYLTRAKDLVEYSYSRCESNCPFKLDSWLVANHQMKPHPVYTQSLLHSYAVLAMLHKQERASNGSGLPLPNWLKDPLLQEALSHISQALQSSMDSDFRVISDYQLIKLDGTPVEEQGYAANVYTVRNYLPPTSGLDALTQYPQGANLAGVLVKGDHLWKYHCSPCIADSSSSLATEWSADKIQNQQVWSPGIPVDSIDTLAMYQDGGTLNAFVFKGDRLWHYHCDAGVCTAQYTNTLANQFLGIQNQGVWVPAIATEFLDAVTFYMDGTTLNAFFYKGDRLWHYHCDAGVCTAQYTNTLVNQFSGVQNQGVWNPPFPIESLDGASSYLDQTTFNGYAIQGDYIWHYHCESGVCTAQYVNLLGESWRSIQQQALWSPELSRYAGVVDWGFDGSIQNSAYAALALIGGHWDRFQALQSARDRLGLKQHPFFPPRYENGQWSFGNFIGARPGDTAALTDDLRVVLDAAAGTVGTVLPPSLDQRLNSHWFFNTLDGYNHAIAYLLLTPRQLLGMF